MVVEPDAWLMDEPLSALDVLTAVNLRSELLNLWSGKDFPTKAILIVTHNIEEAVQTADRIFVLASNPGRFKAEIQCSLARRRDRRSPEFEALVDQISGIMTEQRPAGGLQAPVVDAAEMLGFAKVADADLELTPGGKAWVEAEILT